MDNEEECRTFLMDQYVRDRIVHSHVQAIKRMIALIEHHDGTTSRNSKVVQHRPAHVSDGEPVEHPAMSEEARRAKSDQIIASKADHLIRMRDKLQKGGNVYLMINDFNFLIKCGIEFSKEE